MEQLTGNEFQLIGSTDDSLIQLIASWYRQEWNIDPEVTIKKIKSFTGEDDQFQLLMTRDDLPVATGGIYRHVGLLDKEPRFRQYPYWLALLYTVPHQRGKGFGQELCAAIESAAIKRGIQELALFTDTAERLYRRLGWVELERLKLGNRNIVVMKKILTGKQET